MQDNVRAERNEAKLKCALGHRDRLARDIGDLPPSDGNDFGAARVVAEAAVQAWPGGRRRSRIPTSVMPISSSWHLLVVKAILHSNCRGTGGPKPMTQQSSATNDLLYDVRDGIGWSSSIVRRRAMPSPSRCTNDSRKSATTRTMTARSRCSFSRAPA